MTVSQIALAVTLSILFGGMAGFYIGFAMLESSKPTPEEMDLEKLTMLLKKKRIESELKML